MNTRKQRWSEDDIAELKGQEESIRLQFKAGSLFDKPQQAWVGDLSKEVLAFANTEGGVPDTGVDGG